MDLLYTDATMSAPLVQVLSDDGINLCDSVYPGGWKQMTFPQIKLNLMFTPLCWPPHCSQLHETEVLLTFNEPVVALQVLCADLVALIDPFWEGLHENMLDVRVYLIPVNDFCNILCTLLCGFNGYPGQKVKWTSSSSECWHNGQLDKAVFPLAWSFDRRGIQLWVYEARKNPDVCGFRKSWHEVTTKYFIVYWCGIISDMMTFR